MNLKESKPSAETILNSRFGAIAGWALAIVLVTLSTGCNEQQGYVGQRLDPPAERIVLFEIEGPDGPEFTQMLATQITQMGKVVVHGSQFGEPVDLLTAAKITRDSGAPAFVMGRLTASDIVDLSQYTVSGTFTVHEAEAGDQIGGIVNVSHSENFDELLGVGKLLSSLSEADKRQFAQEKLKQTQARAVECRRQLAEYVGSELCCEAFGGVVAHRHMASGMGH